MIPRSAFIGLLFVIAASAPVSAAARVFFVDNGVAEEGMGTRERPFRSIAAAVSAGGAGAVIYVAEGNAVYGESVALRRGQSLIGAAYGLVEFDEPSVPAVQGPGPSIAGTITMPGDNIVAGLTVLAEARAGVVAERPHGALSLRNVWIRSSAGGYAVVISEADGPFAITGGGVITSSGGGGVSIVAGRGDVTFDRFPISGDGGTAVAISDRMAGSVKLTNGTTISLDGATRDGVAISRVQATVTFDDRLTIRTVNARALFIAGSGKVTMTAQGSRLASANAAAVDIRDSNVDIVLESASANELAPGKLMEGIAINRMRGRLAVTGTENGEHSGGVISDARAYGARIEQSDNVRIAKMHIVQTATVAGKNRCPADLDVNASVVCRAGLFIRHLNGGHFDNVRIERAGHVGVNLNNVEDVHFTNLSVVRAGDIDPQPGISLQEVKGLVSIRQCDVSDAGAAAVSIVQRFNTGTVVLDRCTLSSAQRLVGSDFLFRTRTDGAARLAVELKDTTLHDNEAAGAEIRAGDTSTLDLTMTSSRTERFGAEAMRVSAHQSSQVRMVVRGTTFIAPGTRPAVVNIEAADTAAICLDASANRFSVFPEQVGIRVATKSTSSQLRLVAPRTTIEAGTLAARFRQSNGAIFAIDAPAASVAVVESCR